MRILVLGGVAESRELTQRLIDADHQVTYSIAGLVRVPSLACDIHVGGFSSPDTDGVRGLVQFCEHNQIERIIDATHPYAVQMSEHAVQAGHHLTIPVWRLTRSGWNKNHYPTWQDYRDFDDLMVKLEPYRRPFLSIGASVLQHVRKRPAHQQWVVRTARPQPAVEGVTLIEAIGPFNYNDELSLLQGHRIDALVSKNSGCRRIIHKVDAAKALDLPIFVLERPQLPSADRQFTQIDSLLESLKNKKDNVSEN